MQTPDATWLGPWPSGWDVRHVAETGSTNADLAVLAGSGVSGRVVLATDHQTAGRGRLGRTWEAPPGANLLVSILFRESIDHPHRLTQRVALAAAAACEPFIGRRPDLKWPNDLLLDDRKLAGILAQAGGRGAGLDHVIVGLGLNVGWAPPDAACLGAGAPAQVLRGLLEELDRQPVSIHDGYRSALSTLGREVRVELPTETFVGVAIDVLDDGTLVVRHDGADRRVAAGDVVHLRVTNP